ncbi:efflux RND transporter periplasmic adaptor subunit [Flavobacterium sp. I3-2]|uniref:efflux RND transporter periplasmic adaptor subunit n=1 Tax=Flavobacterium sp. I3-2 TaxID=2748319 RepID=UPI0015B09F15|nr:efflux RND transporter periplasmic adaptor subunit [Flavobacterium sp. I3-2]
MKKISRYILVTGFFMTLFSCAKNTNEQMTVSDSDSQKFCLNEQLKKTTQITEVSEQPVQEQMTFSGKIEYNENDLVAFKSLLEGFVENVSFELGDYVKQGQVLATVKSFQIQELIQQQKALQSQIVFLEQKKKSQQEMLQDGLLAAPELLETEHELSQARLDKNRIQENLNLYKAIGNGIFQIVAPKNGYIIQKNISKGQTLTSDSEPLFAISNLKQVWVMVNIYASNLRYIKVGDAVKVRTVAYPDDLYQGKIDKIYNVFDDNEHVLKARVVLENQELNLMPGLGADIIIDKNLSNEVAFAIPNKAKVFNNNKEYVVVYKNDCELEIRKINSFAQNEEFTYIKEKFDANEKIVTTNALLIFEQLKP